MAETKTRTRKSTTAKASSSTSSSGSSSKANEHFAAAIRAIASRVVFLSEQDALDVEDHLLVAVGKGEQAKEAQKRIDERNPDNDDS